MKAGLELLFLWDTASIMIHIVVLVWFFFSLKIAHRKIHETFLLCSQILAFIRGIFVCLACMCIHIHGKYQKKSHSLQIHLLLYNIKAECLRDSAPGTMVALLAFQLFIGNPLPNALRAKKFPTSVRRLARKVLLFQQYCSLATGLLKTEIS